MKTTRQYQIYKPTKNNTGAALQFNVSNDLSCVWMEMTKQVGHQQFDWDNKIVFKLGTNDLISLIYALEIVRTAAYKKYRMGDEKSFDSFMESLCDQKGNLVNLFHNDKNKNNTSSLVVKPNAAKYRGGFRFQLSKNFSNGNKLYYNISLSPEETIGVLYTLEKPLKAEPKPWKPAVKKSNYSYSEDGEITNTASSLEQRRATGSMF